MDITMKFGLSKLSPLVKTLITLTIIDIIVSLAASWPTMFVVNKLFTTTYDFWNVFLFYLLVIALAFACWAVYVKIVNNIWRKKYAQDLVENNYDRIMNHEDPDYDTYDPAAIWQTIKVGVEPRTKDGFYKALEEGRYLGGRDPFSGITLPVVEEETELDLVALSGIGLGFDEDTNLKSIYARAKELGLELCPAEIGPRLMLANIFMHDFKYFYIGMKPLEDSDGDIAIFAASYCGGYLDLVTYESDLLWNAKIFAGKYSDSYVWVFVRPR